MQDKPQSSSLPWSMALSLALAPGIAFMAAFTWMASAQTGRGRLFTLFDDAMISMTYARTLATTGKLVWFPGADPVEGITNPLWTLWMAVVHVAGFRGSAAALIISVTGLLLVAACAALTAVIVRNVTYQRSTGNRTALFAGAVVPLLYPLAFWSLRGMEVGLLACSALAMTLGVLLSSSRRAGDSRGGLITLTAVAACIGTATRLDFAIIAAAIIGVALLTNSDARLKRQLVTWVAVTVVATIIGVLLIQYAAWGDWLPNTYRLKMEGYSIADRVARGGASALRTLPLLWLTAGGLAVVVTSRVSVGVRRAALLCAAVFATVILYSVWVGGDAWEDMTMANRYISVGLPFAVAVVFIGHAVASDSLATIGRPKVVIFLLLFALTGVAFGVKVNPIRVEPDYAAMGFLTTVIASALLALALLARTPLVVRRRPTVPQLLALSVATLISVNAMAAGELALRDHFAPGSSDAKVTQEAMDIADVTAGDAVIATVWAGAPGYYLERPMIDLLGKSDRKIASEAPRVPVGTGWFTRALDSLYPGHNKWDYAYSIGQLRPDVVFQLWWTDAQDLADLADWGYRPFCTHEGGRAYFLQSSPRVRFDRLEKCPDPPG